MHGQRGGHVGWGGAVWVHGGEECSGGSGEGGVWGVGEVRDKSERGFSLRGCDADDVPEL